MHKKSKMYDDIEFIKNNFSYDPETGVVTYLKTGYTGRVTNRGYVGVAIRRNGVNLSFLAHRLAFIIMKGRDIGATMVTDHLNRDRTDNRWCNLREVDYDLNRRNSERSFKSTNKYVYPGIFMNKNKFIGCIHVKNDQGKPRRKSGPAKTTPAEAYLDRVRLLAIHGDLAGRTRELSIFMPMAAKEIGNIAK